MKFLILLLIGMLVFKAAAQMAVHDETNRQQLYLNAVAQIKEIKASRKWLDLIIRYTSETTNVSKTIEDTLSDIKQEMQDLTKKIGDPKLIDTGAHSTGEAKVIKNLSLQKIRDAAKNDSALKAYDSETLYGAESTPEFKYQVAEAAYINYEKVLAENHDTKRSLIAKRGALALALKSVRSLAEIGKISSALQIVNGKLDTIKEQEQQALNKLVSIQIRNDQKEKLKTKARSRKIMMDFFNADILMNAVKGDK